MGTITTELMADGQTRGYREPKLTTPERRVELLRVYAESGLTRAAFAQRKGLQYATFASWVQSRRAAPTARGSPHKRAFQKRLS